MSYVSGFFFGGSVKFPFPAIFVSFEVQEKFFMYFPWVLDINNDQIFLKLFQVWCFLSHSVV